MNDLFMPNNQASETQVIILLGPPGAGKGSQAALIKETVGLAHISTGDLLRENIKRGTALGIQAKIAMDQGALVSDDLIFQMLFARVEEPDCKRGYILDGFPRNLAQAETLQKRLESTNTVAINFSVSDDIIIERITKREICKECQRPYHLSFSPPKETGKCDHCDGELYHRSDDTEEVVQNRLLVYHEKTAPLINFYQNQNILHQIDSSQSKDKILQQVLLILQSTPTHVEH